MRIKSIEIENYRQYKSISFSFDRISGIPNDLNIIIAQNGVGKSNFLNAITWCLYEEESHLQDKNKALPIVNLQSIESASEKESITVRVSLKVEVNGDDITITREAKYVKNSDIKEKVLRVESQVAVHQKSFDNKLGYAVPDIIYADEAESLINRLFPQGISQYFFFDNEQMNNYFKANSGGAISQAINEISKVSIVQHVNGRLKTVEKSAQVDLGASDKKLEDLRKDLEMKEERFNTEKDHFNELNDQIEKAKDTIEELNDQLKGVENLKALEDNRDLLMGQLDSVKQDLDSIEEDLDSFITRYLTLINMYPDFLKTLELIEEKKKNKQFPPNISDDVLLASKNNKVCELCGNHLDEQHLLFVIEKLNRLNVASPVYELLNGISRKIIELKEEVERYPDLKNSLLIKKESKESDLEETQNKLNDVNKAIKAIPNKEEITEKINKRDDLGRQLDFLLDNRGYTKSNMQQYERDYDEASRKFEAALNQHEREGNKEKSYRAVKKLRKVLGEVETEIINEMREEIAAKTYENFINLVWKKNTYAKVSIDESYNVDLIHVKGNSAIGSTSAAERALLALSFTNAIHEISGFESPIVIDSPVGRVSDENRRKFAESLSEISKHKQIIMLFTPDEYSKDISEVFDSVAVKSRAQMNESEDVTTIKGDR